MTVKDGLHPKGDDKGPGYGRREPSKDLLIAMADQGGYIVPAYHEPSIIEHSGIRIPRKVVYG